MMSQGMFGGFNGQGMGMNGMNMGMGFDGGYGGWGGQSVMGMGGMNGDFGANAGYYPGGGYNQQSHQGHFNQMHNQQFPNDNYHQNRFHRGQGHSQRGYGHGQGRYAGHGQNNHSQGFKENNSAFHHQLPTGFQDRRPSQQPSAEPQELPQTEEIIAEDKASKEPESLVAGDDSTSEVPKDGHEIIDVRAEDETRTNQQPEIIVQDNDEAQPQDIKPSIETVHDEAMADAGPAQEEEALVLHPIATIDSIDPPVVEADVSPVPAMLPTGPAAAPLGPAAHFTSTPAQDFPSRGRGGMRGYGRGGYEFRGPGHRGRGSMHMSATFGHFAAAAEYVAVPMQPSSQGVGVVGAPKGPKAMREGLPNVGFRGRGGFQVSGRGARAVPTGPALLQSR